MSRTSFNIHLYAASFDFCDREERRTLFRVLTKTWRQHRPKALTIKELERQSIERRARIRKALYKSTAG